MERMKMGMGSRCLNMLFCSELVWLPPEHLSHFFFLDSFLIIFIYSTWSIEKQEDTWSESEFLKVSVHKKENTVLFFLSFFILCTELTQNLYCIFFWKQSGFEAKSEKEVNLKFHYLILQLLDLSSVLKSMNHTHNPTSHCLYYLQYKTYLGGNNSQYLVTCLYL